RVKDALSGAGAPARDPSGPPPDAEPQQAAAATGINEDGDRSVAATGQSWSFSELGRVRLRGLAGTERLWPLHYPGAERHVFPPPPGLVGAPGSEYERAECTHAAHYAALLEREGPRLEGAGAPDEG